MWPCGDKNTRSLDLPMNDQNGNTDDIEMANAKSSFQGLSTENLEPGDI